MDIDIGFSVLFAVPAQRGKWLLLMTTRMEVKCTGWIYGIFILDHLVLDHYVP